MRAANCKESLKTAVQHHCTERSESEIEFYCILETPMGDSSYGSDFIFLDFKNSEFGFCLKLFHAVVAAASVVVVVVAADGVVIVTAFEAIC